MDWVAEQGYGWPTVLWPDDGVNAEQVRDSTPQQAVGANDPPSDRHH